MNGRHAVAACLLLALPTLAALPSASGPSDDLDAFITREMARRHIPGLSLAVVQDGRVVTARAYGVTDTAGGPRVTTATLFQAGSVSKPVAALGALRLVEAGKLDLDQDVNTRLTSWKVPANRFTAAHPVTLREILSHSAGLTVHGFAGYDRDSEVPTVVQVLDGVAPANSPAVRVDTTPGAIGRYSGGGYVVMQQMMMDVTGERFPAYMRRTVLDPFGMSSSTYEQPPDAVRRARTAAGVYQDRSPVRGRWHVYPEMTAAGLWTTPSDLARFIIGVQQAWQGKANPVISAAMARQYLTAQKDQYGLGIAVSGSGRALRFSHGGRNEGFDTWLAGYAATGQGAVIMINANDDSRLMIRIAQFLSRKYHWPPSAADSTPPPVPVALSADWAPAFAGRYEPVSNVMWTFAADAGHLVMMEGGFPDEEFIAVGDHEFVSTGGDVRLSFATSGPDAGTLTWTDPSQTLHAPRLGPPAHALRAHPDPDPARTDHVRQALHAFAQGGKGLAQVQGLTAGVQRDLADYSMPGAALEPLVYLDSVVVGGHGLQRHGSPVATILYYRLGPAAGGTYLMVHLTADGTITDFDAVED